MSVLLNKKDLYEKKHRGKLVSVAASFAASFLFCGFSVGGGLSPFGVSFALSLPYNLLCAGIPGCALGYATSLGTADALRYWGAIALSGTLRVILHRKKGSKKAEFLSPAISASGVFLSGIILLFVRGITLGGALLLSGEAAVCVCAGVFFKRTVFLSGVKSNAVTMSLQDKIFVVCSACLLLLCASGFTVMGVSAVRILSFMLVMFAASYKGPAFGCASGVSIGAFLSASPGFGCLLPCMAVGGLMSGLFSGYGQSACAAAFSFALTVICVVQGKGESFFIISAEALIAFGAFSLVPAEFIRRIRDFITEKGLVRNENTESAAAHELSVASENVYRICETINSAATRREKNPENSEGEEVTVSASSDELERVLTDQFRGVGDFLGELSLRMNKKRISDASFSASLKTALRNDGIDVDELEYFYDSRGAVTVEMSLSERPLDIDHKKAAAVIELITGRSFEKPEVVSVRLGTTLTFNQKMPFRLQIGFSRRSAHEGEPCGDSVSAASSVDGRGFALISDGMGTGYQAANDSGITSRVMKRLICSGFSFDSALKIVNSALIARSAQESVASIDAVEVNLFTGETFFYKAGAACSIIRKRERTVTLERSSMPLGIIRNIGFSKTRFTGEAGDIILLLSDGVTQTDHGWINDELLSWSTNSMEELSRHILRLASLRRDRATADDMTVVAVKIEKNGQ